MGALALLISTSGLVGRNKIDFPLRSTRKMWGWVRIPLDVFQRKQGDEEYSLASLDLLGLYFSEIYMCKSENTGHPYGVEVDNQHCAFDRVFRSKVFCCNPSSILDIVYGHGEAI